MNFHFKQTLAQLAVQLLLAAPALAAVNPYKGLSEEIARAAAENSVKRVAVQCFEARGGAGGNEGAYVAEQVSAALSAYKKISLIERSLLEGVLKEARLSADAGGEGASREIFSVDAVVTGIVFPDGDNLKVFVKLIELRTGRVLLSRAAESLRLAGGFMETMSAAMGLPDLPMPGAADVAEFGGAPSDLRDAPARAAPGACVERRMLLASMNEDLVSDKALYWAAKMREPGFSVARLRRNPGAEISDPGLRHHFYKLLKKYYAAGYSSGPRPEKKDKLARLLWLEDLTADECGGNI